MKPRFRATYRRQRNGWRVAVDEASDVIAYGRTLDSARIDLLGQLAERFKVYRGIFAVEDAVELPSSAEKALLKARKAKNAALEAAALSQASTTEAALELTRSGLSLRDVGYLLGLSHGRVQQLLETVTGPKQKKKMSKSKIRSGGRK